MVTKLLKVLRREITVAREAWIVTLTPNGMKLTRKGRRRGVELAWKELVNGDAAFASALNATLALAELPRESASRTRTSGRTARGNA